MGKWSINVCMYVCIKVPVFNDLGSDVTLCKGIQLGTLTELHNEETVVSNVLDDVLCDAMESIETNLHPKVDV